jgi:hypothetical protein
MAKKIRYRLAIVSWNDAAISDDATMEPPLAKTVGWILEKNKDVVRVSSESFEDGTFRDITVIPKSLVKSILYVTPKTDKSMLAKLAKIFTKRGK